MFERILYLASRWRSPLPVVFLECWWCPLHHSAVRYRLHCCKGHQLNVWKIVISEGRHRSNAECGFTPNVLWCRPTVVLIIIGIPSPIRCFTLGLNPSFSANFPYRSLSFSSFRIHYMDFPDCLLLLWACPSFYFLVFLFLHFLVVGSVR